MPHPCEPCSEYGAGEEGGRWQNTCLPMGGGELIPGFAFSLRAPLALPIKLSLSQPNPMRFLPFTFLILSPIPLRGSEQVALWG